MAAEFPSSGWRSVQTFALGHGPLKRGSDRLQFAARLVLLLFALVSVPVALAAGTVVHEELQDAAERRAAELVQVTAVAVEDARSTEGPHSAGSPRATARWTAPDGSPVEARVDAPAGTSVGDPVTVWTTADGRLAVAPMNASEVTNSTIVFVGLGWSFSSVAAGTAYAALCWLLDRQRDRRWTREWAAIEPHWSRRVP